MENVKRLEYLDCVKGFGILLVILGHIYAWNPDINRGIIVTWIYSFHMPLFFIVSGMLIKYKYNNNTKEFIISKVKHILIPYIIFSLCNSIINIILYGFNINSFILDIVYTFTLIGVDMWFLQVLFLSEVIFILLKRFIKNKYIRMCFISMLFITSLFITKEDRFLLQYSSRVFISLGFIEIGYILMNLIKEKKISNILLIILLGIQIILSKYNGYVDLNNLVFNNKILYVVNSVIGTISIILLFKNINIKTKMLKYYGMNSLIIFVTHGNLIYLFRKFISVNMHGYISGLVLFVLIIAIQIPIIYTINNYTPWMLGKFKKKEKLEVAVD